VKGLRAASFVVLVGQAACGGVTGAIPPVAEIPVAPLPRPPQRATRSSTSTTSTTSTSTKVPYLVEGCPEDMVGAGRFCIDRYEAPNEKGELPYALQTAYDGEDWCAARGKRLCTEDEWVRACRGPHGRTYPYGNTFKAGVCSDDHPWLGVSWKKLSRWPQDPSLDEASRLYQADMSGARTECVTEEGAFDMTGNVAEWVRKSATPGKASRSGYEHVLKGCYWAGCYKDPQPSCGFTNGAHPGTFRTYEAGFRCCTPRASAVPSAP
jgi:formylglycine-generating enzyme required for sulfatase activity